MDEMSLMNDFLANSPVAAGILGMAWMFLRYMRERDSQMSQSLKGMSEAISALSAAISHLDGRLDQRDK